LACFRVGHGSHATSRFSGDLSSEALAKEDAGNVTAGALAKADVCVVSVLRR
jgi:hypothetical protein